MKNILITGAHGFVGKTLSGRLEKELNSKMNLFTPSSKELDLRNYSDVVNYLKNHEINVVYHLAARLGGVHLVTNKPLEYLESNLIMNYNIVHASLEAGISKFITLGSSCSYAKEPSIPTGEDSLWQGEPENTYGVCKLVMLEHLKNQNMFDYVYFIPPNIYGAGDHFGEADAHFIPATVQKIEKAVKSGNDHIEVWGDGNQTRDFVYINDLIFFLIEAFVSNKYDNVPLNISTGREVTVREAVELIIDNLGYKDRIFVSWAKDKPVGPKRKALNNNKILKLSHGYSFTSFETGIAQTLNEYKTIKMRLNII